MQPGRNNVSRRDSRSRRRRRITGQATAGGAAGGGPWRGRPVIGLIRSTGHRPHSPADRPCLLGRGCRLVIGLWNKRVRSLNIDSTLHDDGHTVDCLSVSQSRARVCTYSVVVVGIPMTVVTMLMVFVNLGDHGVAAQNITGLPSLTFLTLPASNSLRQR